MSKRFGERVEALKAEKAAIIKAHHDGETEVKEFFAESKRVDDEIAELANSFSVGDKVSYSQGTDVSVGVVARISASGKSIWVSPVRTKLVNGSESGEPDALKFVPGGFVGHTSGVQRYGYEPIAKSDACYREKLFSFRARTGEFKEAGTSINGSMRSWGVLFHGWHKHYDYNF